MLERHLVKLDEELLGLHVILKEEALHCGSQVNVPLSIYKVQD